MEGELIYSLSKADNTASCLGYFLSGQSFLSVLHSILPCLLSTPSGLPSIIAVSQACPSILGSESHSSAFSLPSPSPDLHVQSHKHARGSLVVSLHVKSKLESLREKDFRGPGFGASPG